ncbi:Serine/threonine protein kinase [Abeliophyllum distichum]|uniref:Serine/threonine protein kinase n=1 Tax=Abeliophyllum distichum TaxID=126358 RepID=A0ABD1SWS9_9LAMI
MPIRNLLFSGSTIFILFVSCLTICRGQNNSYNVPSSCGNINIKHPFSLGLKGVSQNNADTDFNYTLECQNNQTIYYSGSMKFRVQAINYNDYTIRLSDPGLDSHNYSSCPIYSSNQVYNILPSSSDTWYNNIDITFVNCLSPVNNTLYVKNAFCSDKTSFSNYSGIHSYVAVGSIMTSDLEQHCNIDRVYPTSAHWPIKDITSYSSIHDLLAYGFEIKWYFPPSCHECYSINSDFVVEKNCNRGVLLPQPSFFCK